MFPSRHDEHQDLWQGWNDIGNDASVDQEYTRNKKFRQILEKMTIASRAATSMQELLILVTALHKVGDYHNIFTYSFDFNISGRVVYGTVTAGTSSDV